MMFKRNFDKKTKIILPVLITLFVVLSLLFFEINRELKHIKTHFDFGPTTHILIGDIYFREYENDVVRRCRNYKTEYEAGSLLPDITVRFYLTQGFRYKATHNWNFVESMMPLIRDDRDYCFVMGIIGNHYAGDIVSHSRILGTRPDSLSGMIPLSILKYGAKNVNIHPVREFILEEWVVTNYPHLKNRAESALDILRSDKPNFNPHLLYMVKTALANENINVEEDIKTLDNLVGSFYKDLFVVDELHSMLAPVVAASANSGENEFFVREAVKMANFLHTQPNERNEYEPHGFTALTLADKTVKFGGLLPEVPNPQDATQFLLNLIRIIFWVLVALAVIIIVILLSRIF